MTYPWNFFQGYSSDNRILLATNHRKVEVFTVLRVHGAAELYVFTSTNLAALTLPLHLGFCTMRLFTTGVSCDALTSFLAHSTTPSPLQTMAEPIVEEVVTLFVVARRTFGMVVYDPALRPPL